MSDHCIHPPQADYATYAYLGDEPPDLGPLRALAHRTELAGSVRPMRRQAGL
jgi:hypothetical protein